MHVDTAQRRDITQGLWRSSGGYELALSPVILALIGLWVDHRLGTSPLFTVLAGILGFVGAAVKLYYVYQHDMVEIEQAGPWAKHS